MKKEKLHKVGKYEKRRDWRHYHEVIKEKYYTHIKENKKIPSVKYLSTETGLSDTAIENHLKSSDISDFDYLFTPLIPELIWSVCKEALKSGKKAEVLLALQIISKFKLDNVLQISFTEAEAKEKIENLFLK